MAASTLGTPSASPKTQSVTARAMVATMMRSSRLGGPMAARRARAASGASGVSFSSGGSSLKTARGVTKSDTSAGTDAATNQVTHGLDSGTPVTSAASLRARRF